MTPYNWSGKLWMPKQMVHGSLERGPRIIGTLGLLHTLDHVANEIAVLLSQGSENDEPVFGPPGRHCSEQRFVVRLTTHS